MCVVVYVSVYSNIECFHFVFAYVECVFAHVHACMCAHACVCRLCVRACVHVSLCVCVYAFVCVPSITK